MFNRINRYIAKEIFLSWLGVSSVLVIVLLINRLVRFLNDAASGEISADLVFTLLWLKAAAYLPLILPFTFFLAIMMVLGRMNRDNELPVMLGCGAGPSIFYKSFSIVAVPLGVLIIWLSFFVVPWANNESGMVQKEEQEKGSFAAIEPGRFISTKDGSGVFYAGKVDSESGEMYDLFLHSFRDGNETIIRAQSAKVEDVPELDAKYIVFYDGSRYEGEKGKLDWRSTNFASHGMQISKQSGSREFHYRKNKSSYELLKSDLAEDKAELHWRLALPIMFVVLVFLVLPLGKGNPREGKFGRLFIGIVIFLVYLKLLTFGKSLVVKESVPAVLGLWWIHAIFITLGFVLYRKGFRVPKARIISKGATTSRGVS